MADDAIFHGIVDYGSKPGITPAPTQQPVTVTGMVFARTRDGKLVEG